MRSMLLSLAGVLTLVGCDVHLVDETSRQHRGGRDSGNGVEVTEVEDDGSGNNGGSNGSSSGTDADGDGYTSDVDCDDGWAGTNPAADEWCTDGADNDCDGLVDEDCGSGSGDLTCCIDGDGDGYGNGNTATEYDGACPSGWVANGSDWCDDQASADTYEECNGTEENDDTYVVCYVDSDSDGYGDGTTAQSYLNACPSGWVANGSDWCDGNAAAQTYDECNGTEEPEGTVYVTCSIDSDGDGYGNDDTTTTYETACPSGWVANDDDACDDDRTEHTSSGCDDEPEASPDADGDGWTVAEGDCDDSDASVHEDCDEEPEATTQEVTIRIFDVDNDVDTMVVYWMTESDSNAWYTDTDIDSVSGSEDMLLWWEDGDGNVNVSIEIAATDDWVKLGGMVELDNGTEDYLVDSGEQWATASVGTDACDAESNGTTYGRDLVCYL